MSSELTVRGQCVICFGEEFKFEDFRIFPCGHSFCETCVDKLYVRSNISIPCPYCRENWLRRDAHKILLFQPIVHDSNSVNRVINGLSRMDKNCKTISVKNAHTKLSKVANNVDGDTAERLLKAIDDFRDRIAPLFEEMEESRKKVAKLEVTNQNLTINLATKSSQLDACEKEARELRKSNVALEKKFLQAVDTAGLSQKQVTVLEGKLTNTKKSLAAKEQDYKKVKDLLDRHKHASDTRERKLKTLKEQVAGLNAQLQEKEHLATAVQNSLMDVDESAIETRHTPREAMKLSKPAPLYSSTGDDSWLNVDDFAFEGIPRPGFRSNWNINNKKPSVLTKPGNSSKDGKNPLKLDRKGHPTTAIQCGPKTSIRRTF